MSWYCDYASARPHHVSYHDTEYGFALSDERLLLERLALEIMQAGLSWDLVMQRRAGMNDLFDQFEPDVVAAYGEQKRAQLLSDARNIRNRLKVAAIIHNARIFQDLRRSHGGMAAWLAGHHPRALPDWVKLFRETFKFTGPEIVNEFLMSIGYLPGAHRPDCPIYAQIEASSPPWRNADMAIFTNRS